MLSIAEQMTHMTTIIATDKGTGTGFFYSFEYAPNRWFTTVVTNQHVIDSASDIEVLITKQKEVHMEEPAPDFGEYIKIKAKLDDVILHPNPDIDLAMIVLNQPLLDAENNGIMPFLVVLTDELIADKEYYRNMDAVEPICMVGYPIGLFDQKHNLPIVRKGITATRPQFDYNDKPEFLIDCACWPGSSGSPVFHYDPGVIFKNEDGAERPPLQFRFLGIMYGGPMYTAEGKVVTIPAPLHYKDIAAVDTAINLGMCIKGTQLDEFKVAVLKKCCDMWGPQDTWPQPN